MGEVSARILVQNHSIFITMKIGIIQTNAIGDIIIALPIAQWYLDQGHEIYWPIDVAFINMFTIAAPGINFLPIERIGGQFTYDYFIGSPEKLLQDKKCEKIFTLYSHLTGIEFHNGMKSIALKFDEYKYAVSGVPFLQKWKLRISRNPVNEQRLINKLNINQPYIVLNEKAGPGEVIAPIPIGDDLRSQFRIIHVEPLTDSLFDWIPIFENASHIACFDSGPANLIDQLNLKVSKTLYLRSSALFTPVFASGWSFP